MSYLAPWTTKHQPRVLDDVVGHDSITSTLRKFIAARVMPHLLFHGPNGVGKSSVAHALAREWLGSHAFGGGGNSARYARRLHPCLMCINSSDFNSSEILRREIQEFIDTHPIFVDYSLKLVVVDDADFLTADQQTVICDIIASSSHLVRFIMVAKFIYRLSSKLQSRLTCVRMNPVDAKCIILLGNTILNKEVPGEKTGPDKCETYARIHELQNACGGDVRRFVNYLQAAHSVVSIGNNNSSARVADALYGNNHVPDAPALLQILGPTASANDVQRAVSIILDGVHAAAHEPGEYVRACFAVLSRSATVPHSARFLRLCVELAEIEFQMSFCVDLRIQSYALALSLHIYLITDD